MFLGLYQVLLRMARPGDGLEVTPETRIGFLNADEINAFLDAKNEPRFAGERFVADTPLVFTHRDFVPRNLILSSGTLWVVDWGLSGWYPPYTEYCSIAGDWGDRDYPTPVSWKEAVLPLVGDYWRKYEMMHSIRSFIESSYTRSTIEPPSDEDTPEADGREV